MLRKRALLAGLGLVAVSDVAMARGDDACALHSLGPVRTRGRDRCVAVGDGRQMCKRTLDASGATLASFSLVGPDGTQAQWRGEAGVDESFEAMRGDLDGDGTDELIVANHDATGAGIGLRRWTVSIVDAVTTSAAAAARRAGHGAAGSETAGGPAVSFLVTDFGDGTIARGAHGGCEILATEWVTESDAHAGTGLYFVGRPFRYAGTELVADREAPIRQRRWEGAFVGEREGALSGHDRDHARDGDRARPGDWLAAPDAHDADADPLLSPRARASRIVVEGVVRRLTAQGGLRVEVARDGAASGAATVTLDEADEPGAREFNRIGDGRSGHLWPARYASRALFAGAVGRRVQLVSYRLVGDAPPHVTVLWVR